MQSHACPASATIFDHNLNLLESGPARAQLSAKVSAFNYYCSTHFIESRSQGHRYTIFQSLSRIRVATSLIHIVCCEDRKFPVVVARIDYLHESVTHPIGGFRGSQLIEDENVRLKNWSEYLQLRSL